MTSSSGTGLIYTDKNRLGPYKIAEMAAVGALLIGIYVFFGTFEHLWMDWNSPSIDRTYNMAVPLFSLVFVALKWKRIKTTPIRGTLWGLPLLLVGVGMRLMGEPGQVKFMKYCALVFLLGGAVWCVLGTRMFTELLFPLCFLFFMMPVPDPIYQRMSVPLQDFAAKAGFFVSKLVGVGATLSGRKITITELNPPLPLEVAEACSGMKSLLTLGAVAVAFAYITRRDLLTRIFISLSAVPIAIFMNMLRVAGVGVLAKYFGGEAAQGFIHEAQGIFFYIAEVAILFGEGAIISWIFGRPAVEIARAKAVDNAGKAFPRSTRLTAPGLACLAVLAVFTPALYAYHEKVKRLTEGLPPKKPLTEFATGEAAEAPDSREGAKVRTDMDLKIEEEGIQYIGFEKPVEIKVLKAAEVDGHLNIVYFECPSGAKPEAIRANGTSSVTAYVGFHKSASDGINRGAVHYPDQCYPGNGFNTESTDVVQVETPGYCEGRTELARSVFYNDRGLWILVYYHMNNNGRNVVDRSSGKIDNFLKLVLGQRTGFLAQVQFFTVIGSGPPLPGGIEEEKIQEADKRLQRFCPAFLKKLSEYLPDPVE